MRLSNGLHYRFHEFELERKGQRDKGTKGQMKKLISSLFVSMFLFAVANTVFALPITVDPGPLGNAGDTISMSFDDLNGTELNGQTLELDFTFALMKHVELPTSVNQFSTFLSLEVDISGMGDFATGFLSDENGNSILVSTSGGISTGGGFTAWQLDYNSTPAGLLFHDVHIDAPAPSNGATVLGGELRLLTFAGGDMVVGEWTPVPEPATMTLLGIGLVGLVGGVARKKSKKKGCG